MKIKSIISIVFFCLSPFFNFGQAPNLGTTSNFALFTASGAFGNTGNTVVTGDVGANVGAFTAFPPGILVGQKHVADPVSVQAAIDVDVAYSSLSATTCGSVIATTLGNNQVLTGNVYCLGAASVLNGKLILDGQGNPNTLFIFKINGAFSTNAHASVVLINSASLCNVYWQVNGAFNLGDSSIFRGTVIANGAISLLAASKLFGRGLSRQGAISLHSNIVTLSGLSSLTISANGPVTFCSGDSVILSGNHGGIWNNGSHDSSIVVRTSGNYFVTSTNSCGGNSNIIHVTVTPGPICNINCAGSLCQGSVQSICSSYKAGNTYLWNTGATSRCINVQSGTYTVHVTNNGCTSTCSTTISNSSPVCNITGSNNICQGSSTTLCTNNVTGNTYYWNTGATSSCITVSQAGTYIVTVTNNGCSSTCSKTVSAGGVAPICNITGNSVICQGASTTLCGPSGSGYSYLWNNNTASRCITVNNAGTYTLTITKNGCSKTSSKKVIKQSAPLCAITGNLSPSFGHSTSLCASAGLNTYHWNTGAVTRCINVNNSGTFTVTVTNSSGCTNVTAVQVHYHAREVLTENDNATEERNLEVNVYPNPLSSYTNIEFKSTIADSYIMIDFYDFLGNKIASIFNSEVEKGVLNKTIFNAENLPKGIYILKVSNKEQTIIKKLILMD